MEAAVTAMTAQPTHSDVAGRTPDHSKDSIQITAAARPEATSDNTGTTDARGRQAAKAAMARTRRRVLRQRSLRTRSSAAAMARVTTTGTAAQGNAVPVHTHSQSATAGKKHNAYDSRVFLRQRAKASNCTAVKASE